MFFGRAEGLFVGGSGGRQPPRVFPKYCRQQYLNYFLRNLHIFSISRNAGQPAKSPFRPQRYEEFQYFPGNFPELLREFPKNENTFFHKLQVIEKTPAWKNPRLNMDVPPPTIGHKCLKYVKKKKHMNNTRFCAALKN